MVVFFNMLRFGLPYLTLVFAGSALAGVLAVNGVDSQAGGLIHSGEGQENIFLCPPCGCNKDKQEFSRGGKCPACGMQLTRKGVVPTKEHSVSREIDPHTKVMVTVETGTLEGSEANGIRSFKGVPFAAPPIGALRWKPPQRAISWTGTRNADKFGPIPLQAGESFPGAEPEAMSEDCLYLNLWMPAAPKQKSLPVMVWIYGGGFANGSASIPLYWGEELAKRGVVIVTVGYRVGPFGFFAHSELTRESGKSASGNYGLMDQIAALKWIQRNIAAFGGDPQRVTIWGQSAGSMSVSLLMASPIARGLFHRAIGQSGGVFIPSSAVPGPIRDSWTLAGAEKLGAAICEQLGVSNMQDARALSGDKILSAFNPLSAHPIIDGYVLVEEPRKTFANGREASVPVLLGFNAEEAHPLLVGTNVSSTHFVEDTRNVFGTLPDSLFHHYPHSNDAEAFEARAAIERDVRFGWDMRSWARLHAVTDPVYFYHFSHRPPNARAGHWTELHYVFNHLDQVALPWTAVDRSVANAMAGYWTNFAKYGDPNGRYLTPWPRYRTGSEQVLRIADRFEAGVLPNTSALDLLDLHFLKPVDESAR